MRKWIPVIWGVNIVGIIISCYMTYYKSVITGVLNSGESQTFHSSFALLNCIAVFMTVKVIAETFKIPEKLEKIVLILGKSTFGVYLLHLFVLSSSLMQDFLNLLVRMGINAMISACIQCFCVMAICYVFTIILKKIPLVKYLL